MFAAKIGLLMVVVVEVWNKGEVISDVQWCECSNL